jgi:hypothetical protein
VLFPPEVRRRNLLHARAVQIELDVKSTIAANDLLIRGAAKGAEQHRVVDRFQQIRLTLRVSAENGGAASRRLANEVGQVAVPSNHQPPNPHYWTKTRREAMAPRLP